MPPLSPSEVTDLLPADRSRRGHATPMARSRRARARRPGAGRRPRRLRARDRRRHGGHGDRAAAPIRSARSRRCSRRDGALAARARFCYELRLHRARGYGALKAILDILAEEEPLTLTEISQRLQPHAGLDEGLSVVARGRGPVTSRQKRYSFTDPLLRLWVRLHCRPSPPTDEDVAREVQRYALARLPQPEPAMALVAHGGGRTSGGEDDRGKGPWGIIEID